MKISRFCYVSIFVVSHSLASGFKLDWATCVNGVSPFTACRLLPLGLAGLSHVGYDTIPRKMTAFLITCNIMIRNGNTETASRTITFLLSWFRSVVAITLASHARGPGFEPQRNHIIFFIFQLSNKV